MKNYYANNNPIWQMLSCAKYKYNSKKSNEDYLTIISLGVNKLINVDDCTRNVRSAAADENLLF